MINVYIEISDIRPCFEAFGVLSFRDLGSCKEQPRGWRGWPWVAIEANPEEFSSSLIPSHLHLALAWTNYTLTYPNIMNSTEFDPG